jgi:dUTP pyrophosphatase
MNFKLKIIINNNKRITMSSITFSKELYPKLTVDDYEYVGINILSKLKHLKEEEPNNKEINNYYKEASLFFQNNSIPIVKYMLHDPNAFVPTKSIEDVGYDLTIISEYQRLSSNTCIYDTSVSFQLPLGWYGSVHLRSSASKSGYIMSNCTGIIDPGYTGTVKVALTKIDNEMPNLVLPCRIAQMVISPYVNTELEQTNSTIYTNRGTGGFGSTN